MGTPFSIGQAAAAAVSLYRAVRLCFSGVVFMLAFEMERPRSLASAAEILEKHGSQAMVKAGGTDVIVWMRKHAVHPAFLVDLSEIPD